MSQSVSSVVSKPISSALPALEIGSFECSAVTIGASTAKTSQCGCISILLVSRIQARFKSHSLFRFREELRGATYQLWLLHSVDLKALAREMCL